MTEKMGLLEREGAAEEGYLFLSPEWVHEVTRVVQGARKTDKDFGKLAAGFSLNLMYLVTDIPQGLVKLYGGHQLVIFVRLDKGTVRQLTIGTEPPQEKADFTVASNYAVAKEVYFGELNAANAFINRQIKVEPMREVYRRPRFTAKSIVTGNLMLKIARQVATLSLPSD